MELGRTLEGQVALPGGQEIGLSRWQWSRREEMRNGMRTVEGGSSRGWQVYIGM